MQIITLIPKVILLFKKLAIPYGSRRVNKSALLLFLFLEQCTLPFKNFMFFQVKYNGFNCIYFITKIK